MGCGTSYAGVVAVMAREAREGRTAGYLETASSAIAAEVEERGLHRVKADEKGAVKPLPLIEATLALALATLVVSAAFWLFLHFGP